MANFVLLIFICGLFFLISATAFSVFIVVNRREIGWAKFWCRKCHGTEHCTRVVVFGRYTYFIGNTVFRSVYNILCGTYYSNHREEPQGYGKISSVTITKISVNGWRNTVRYISAAAATAATTVILRLSYLCIKYYRINCLFNCLLIGIVTGK